MPLYDLKCKKCGKIKKDVLLGLSELSSEKEKRCLDLTQAGIKCKCGNGIFEKLISAHGKTAVNWAEWQNPPPK